MTNTYYKRALESVPHSLLLEVLKSHIISTNIVRLLRTFMPMWNDSLVTTPTKTIYMKQTI